MTFTPKQLETYREFFSILDGIARRLVLEGKARVVNGKLVMLEEKTPQRRRRRHSTLSVQGLSEIKHADLV